MYFEELYTGMQIRTAPVTVNPEEMMEFSRKYDNVPLHTDPEYARNTPFGQVIAAVAVNSALLGIGYIQNGQVSKEAISANVDMFYYLATIIPAAMFAIMGLAMLLIYGLSKKKTEDLQVQKAEMLAKQVENNEIAIGSEIAE